MTSPNTYLDEVMQEQAQIEDVLHGAQNLVMSSTENADVVRRSAPPSRPVAPSGQPQGGLKITGRFWRTVIVPPNLYVVHSRRGRDPVVGLGLSFRYNPFTDTFLCAPATMQTLPISARSVSRERQGILVQAYLQFIVEDFKTVYQRLDLSDLSDPFKIINLQLKEQSEASIKDKVATMSIDEVLSDKRPIIEELTARLRSVVQDTGLRVLQVQIKEAVVSSQALWENLQKPYRESQAQIARLASLDRERVIAQREIEDQTKAERERLQTQSDTERLRRTIEVDAATQRAQLEEARVRAELAQIEAQRKLDDARSVARLAAQQRALEYQRVEDEAKRAQLRAALDIEVDRRKLENDVSRSRIDELLVRALPEIVSNLPKPDRSEVVNICSDGGAPDGVHAVVGLLKALRASVGGVP